MHESHLIGRGGNAFEVAMGGQTAMNPPKSVPALTVAADRLFSSNDRLEHLQSRLISVAVNAGLIQLPPPTPVAGQSPNYAMSPPDSGPGMLMRLSDQQSRLERLLETLTDIVCQFEALA